MGKVIFVSGIVLMLLVVLLSMVDFLPPDWMVYILTIIFTFFEDEQSGTVHFTIIRDADNTGYAYLILATLAILSIVLVYYGNKLNKNAEK